MKREQGITLVSLVVTIIILIILAAVSINLTLGEDGIISIARQAKENIELATIEEEIKLNELYTQIDIEEGTSSGNISSDEASEKLASFKAAIANYIEEAGGVKPDSTADEETFGESIKGILKEVTKDATATAAQILDGRTAWVNGTKITGTMIHRGELGGTLNAGESFSVPPGYTTGGTITANSLASQTQATATAEDIIEGETAWVNGELITGSGTTAKTPITIPSLRGHNSAGKTVQVRFDIDVTGYSTITVGTATCTTGASTTTNNTFKITDTETSTTIYDGKRTGVKNGVEIDISGHNKIRITCAAYWEAMEAGSDYNVTVSNIVIK